VTYDNKEDLSWLAGVTCEWLKKARCLEYSVGALVFHSSMEEP